MLTRQFQIAENNVLRLLLYEMDNFRILNVNHLYNNSHLCVHLWDSPTNFPLHDDMPQQSLIIAFAVLKKIRFQIDSTLDIGSSFNFRPIQLVSRASYCNQWPPPISRSHLDKGRRQIRDLEGYSPQVTILLWQLSYQYGKKLDIFMIDDTFSRILNFFHHLNLIFIKLIKGGSTLRIRWSTSRTQEEVGPSMLKVPKPVIYFVCLNF